MESLHNLTDREEVILRVRESLDGTMSPERRAHTLSVEKMAARLGNILLPDKVQELRLAALLHDITKDMDNETQLSLCHRYGLCLSSEELSAEKTLHARTGARFARETYGTLVSEEIFSAIDRHTVGAPEMTTFEKIIFVADLIEETRTYPFCIEMRDYFFTDVEKIKKQEALRRLNEILLRSFEYTLSSLKKKGEPVSPDTLRAYNHLKEEINGI